MVSLIYDGTYAGFLTAVFEVYERRLSEVSIVISNRLQPGMFGACYQILTDVEKAKRVIKGLEGKISASAKKKLSDSFLSELPVCEKMLLQYLRHVFSSKVNIEYDYSNPAVLFVDETAKKVHREKHRMEAFIRFELTKDGIFYAICQPDFNVLPLIEKHFRLRYADQRWLIYDGRRKYGLFYDLTKTEMIEMTFESENNSGSDVSAVYNHDEKLYQELWQHYFKSINIAARKNTKLHIRHMPQRYWKFLTEKRSFS